MVTCYWTAESIFSILSKNDDQVGKALVKLYECQTEDEKLTSSTKESNGKGFNGVDAEILSSFARSYIQYGYLTTNQLSLARKKLKKYCKQLANLANNI